MALTLLTWAGMVFCLSQAGILSGLNLAVFGMSRLELEIEAAGGNSDAKIVLELRKNNNDILTTILWGNVAVNVLLAILSDSILTGVGAFVFATFAITIFGEITPQAYFSRHALKMVSVFHPLLQFYRLLLFPIVKPTAFILDIFLGKEPIRYYREADLKEMLRRHMISDETEVDRMEAIGAINFLTIDDLPVVEEGVPLDPKSIIHLPSRDGKPYFPAFEKNPQDAFLKQINASEKSHVVFVDDDNQPRLVMDADGFLRHALLSPSATDPLNFCHQPVVVRHPEKSLGAAITKLHFDANLPADHIVTHDIILLWSENPRLITSSDLLGRLLRGILSRESTASSQNIPQQQN